MLSGPLVFFPLIPVVWGSMAVVMNDWSSVWHWWGAVSCVLVMRGITCLQFLTRGEGLMHQSSPRCLSPWGKIWLTPAIQRLCEWHPSALFTSTSRGLLGFYFPNLKTWNLISSQESLRLIISLSLSEFPWLILNMWNNISTMTHHWRMRCSALMDFPGEIGPLLCFALLIS